MKKKKLINLKHFTNLIDNDLAYTQHMNHEVIETLSKG